MKTLESIKNIIKDAINYDEDLLPLYAFVGFGWICAIGFIVFFAGFVFIDKFVN